MDGYGWVGAGQVAGLRVEGEAPHVQLTQTAHHHWHLLQHAPLPQIPLPENLIALASWFKKKATAASPGAALPSAYITVDDGVFVSSCSGASQHTQRLARRNDWRDTNCDQGDTFGNQSVSRTACLNKQGYILTRGV